MNFGMLHPREMLQAFLANFEEFDPHAGLERRQAIREIGFVLLSQEAVQVFRQVWAAMGAARAAGQVCDLLEVGAGTGFLAHHLENAGLRVVATEPHAKGNWYGFERRWCDLVVMDAVEAMRAFPSPAVLLSWPPRRGNMAERVVRALEPGRWLIYLGEERGGCTAAEPFFDLVENVALFEARSDLAESLNAVHLSWPWPYARDRWWFWRKR